MDTNYSDCYNRILYTIVLLVEIRWEGRYIDLINVKQAMMEDSQRLREASKEIFLLARKVAETEKDYRVALAKETLLLKDEGYPATLINNLAKGKAADEKFKRDLAKAEHQAARDAMQAIQADLSALQSILRSQEEM